LTTHVPPDTLAAIYDQHPLREETILARVLRQRGTLAGLTEVDLAHDSLTEITDQNHIGGLGAVVGLAARAGVQATSRVLDLGAGLNGAGRVLASFFGCRVDGIELGARRCAEANSLTERVGLESVVTCVTGDATAAALPARNYDVVWGQGAWMHIADLPALFARAAEVLVPDGRVAFEDGCLLRPPANDAEAQALSDLERLWAGRFVADERWRSLLAGAGFMQVTVHDMSGVFAADCRRLFAIAHTAAVAAYPEEEAAAYPLALELARQQVIAYRRFVAWR